jgi:hypothetical protein
MKPDEVRSVLASRRPPGDQPAWTSDKLVLGNRIGVPAFFRTVPASFGSQTDHGQISQPVDAACVMIVYLEIYFLKNCPANSQT